MQGVEDEEDEEIGGTREGNASGWEWSVSTWRGMTEGKVGVFVCICVCVKGGGGC